MKVEVTVTVTAEPASGTGRSDSGDDSGGCGDPGCGSHLNRDHDGLGCDRG